LNIINELERTHNQKIGRDRAGIGDGGKQRQRPTIVSSPRTPR
jgi:hypothetical protein